MKERVAKLWVEALRSGEYKQATTTLISPNYLPNGRPNLDGPFEKHCCLAVLMELARKEGVVVDFACSALDGATKEWAGVNTQSCCLPDDLPFPMKHRSPLSLLSANDTGATFEEIADFVEKHYEVL